MEKKEAKTKIEQINNALEEMIGFSFDLEHLKDSILNHISFPGGKSKTIINEKDIIYSNIATNYYGAWSLRNIQEDDFQVLPYINSSKIEEFNQSDTSSREFWLNYFRQVLESIDYNILSDGKWMMVYSVSDKNDWKYSGVAKGRNKFDGYYGLNDVFKVRNPMYNACEMSNMPIAIKQVPIEHSGRVKYWRKRIKEGALPPIVLLYQGFHLNNSIIIDGHSRLLASILENSCPELITIYPVQEQEIRPNPKETEKRASAVMKQFEVNPKLKVDQLNQLLISQYDDRPFLMNKSTARLNKEEKQWDQEVLQLCEVGSECQFSLQFDIELREFEKEEIIEIELFSLAISVILLNSNCSDVCVGSPKAGQVEFIKFSV